MSDISKPPHYTFSAIETIDVIEAWNLGFCLGNVVKYISRAGRKASSTKLHDLQKARWYLDREIAAAEAQAATHAKFDTSEGGDA